jgi:glycosyltransferase EpsE
MKSLNSDEVNMSPLVSVIMATHNGDERLSRAVDSILNQTYQNFELLICNDGSNNSVTFRILESLIANPLITIITNEINKGLAFSLNRCIEVAKGDYFVRMDDDDISSNDRLEKLVKYLDLNPSLSFVGSFANLTGDKYKSRLSVPIAPIVNDVFNARAFIHASLMIRRAAIQKVGLYTVSEATNRLEDYDLFCKLYEQGIVGKNIPEYLYDISEGANWNKRRTVSFRIREFKLRYYWFKRLKLSLVHLPILLKPLILAFLPQKIYNFIRSKNR